MSAEKQKDPISQALRAEKENIITLGTRLFQCPEPGFQEVESGKILASFLLQENIKVEKGIAFTGLKASIGKEGGYHIVLAADMDALYVNQGTGRYPFHSCGHSIQTSVMAYVLKILKDLQIPEKTGGKVSFLATPAEEFIDFDYRNQLIKEGKIRYYSGKQNMIADGVFDDADCVISMHINGETGTLFDVGSTLAGFLAKKVTFHGKASHSGAAPHLGRNALHAASLCMNAIAFMKDQFAREDGVSIHPVLTSSGGSVNVIPEEVVMETYIRANTLEALLEASGKFDDCAIYSAKALGMTCTVEDKTGYMPLKQSDEINQVIYENMRKICPDEKIVKGVISGASGDIGDLGYLLPCVQFGFSGMKGRIHSSEFEIVDEENAYLYTAEVVLRTVKDIIEKKKKQVRRKDYAQRKQFYLDNWLHAEKS